MSIALTIAVYENTIIRVIKMKLIFCIENKGGYLFFGKRQSKDSALIKWLCDYVGDNRIYASDYSKPLFDGFDVLTDNKDGYCFVENENYPKDNVTELVLCHWNRSYPADKFLELNPKALGLKLCEKHDIVGTSHDKITIEIYR